MQSLLSAVRMNARMQHVINNGILGILGRTTTHTIKHSKEGGAKVIRGGRHQSFAYCRAILIDDGPIVEDAR